MKTVRKIISFIVLVIWASAIYAQGINVSGTVTDVDGIGLPGVTILEKGTSNGIISDYDGNYTIQTSSPDAILVFSYVGFATQEISVNGNNAISITLETDIVGLEEVVVTALGIERDKASLGYSVQELSSEDLAVKDPVSVTNSIQGKIAGVQIKSGSGTVGGSSSMIIRGASSLQGNNQPLYVVDGTPISNYDISANTFGYDFGNGAQDINPDDVETIAVLKGAAATTLWGSRGANGVILITTKSGKDTNGLGIEISSTTTFDQIYILPEFQNEYGGGFSLDFQTFEFDPDRHRADLIAVNGAPYVDGSADESWGPKLDGQRVLHWDSFVPESSNYLQLRPWEANPDNYKNLFRTGVTLSNSVSISKSDEISNFRLGVTHVNQKGIVPNSELDKTTITLNNTRKLTDKLEVFTSYTYVKQKTHGRSQFGYSGSGQTVAGTARIWTQRQVDPRRLEEVYYSDALGQQVGWNMRNIGAGDYSASWTNNPYWVFNNIYADDDKDRVFGNAGLRITINDKLTFSTTARTDFYRLNINDRIGTGDINTNDDPDIPDSEKYSESSRNALENNFEGILNYNSQLGDAFSISALFGGNMRYSQFKRLSSSTVDGLIVDDFYHISNSESPATTSSYFSERRTNSLFFSASLGYNDYLYLDVSARNDWSSTLPIDANSYLYPSISSSFVFSEILNFSALSFGKIRAGYAEVGNDTGPYAVYDAYSTASFGPTTTFTVNNSRNNPSLKNETAKEWEFGLEATFLNGVIGIDATYFDRRTTDQIIQLDISSTSGFSSAWINAGEIQNTGVELLLFGTPVKTSDFSWDISANYSKYSSKINSLYGDLTQYEISNGGRAFVMADVGGDYGTMYALSGYVYNENGEKLVDNNGFYQQSGEPVKIGSILPDFNGGVTNTFNYKNIVFSALVDFQSGGKIYSGANLWGTSSGVTPWTVGTNDKGVSFRNPVDQDGGVRADGVLEDGSPNTRYLNARDFFRDTRNFAEDYIYDASYIKLRELKLGYSLPRELVAKIKLQSVNVSIVARNVALLMSNTVGFDPEQVNTIGKAQGYEGGSLPSTRSTGFNINIKL